LQKWSVAKQTHIKYSQELVLYMFELDNECKIFIKKLVIK